MKITSIIHRAAIFAGIVFLLNFAFFSENAKGAEISHEKLAPILEKLESARIAERNQAEAELINLGPEIEPFLPDPDAPATPPETARRVGSILKRFERDAIEAAGDSVEFKLISVSKKSIKSDNAPERFLYWFTLETSWAETTRPVRFKFPMNKIRAENSLGQRLEPQNPNATLEAPVNHISERKTSLRFAMESEQDFDATDLVLIGESEGLLALREQEFSFVNPFELLKSTQRKGETSVRMMTAYEEDGLARVRVSILYENPHDAMQSHRTWVDDNPAILRTKKDTAPLKLKQMRPLKRTETDIALEYVYEIPTGTELGPELEWIYKTATLFRDEPKKFRLKME